MTRNLEARGVCAAIVASGAVAAAELQPSEDSWPARWNKIGPVEAGVVGGLATSLIFLEFLLKAPSTPRWDEPILFDADARSALRAGSPGGRSRAAIASDFGYGGLSLYAIAVEAGLDRESTRLKSSHPVISYAVFFLKKKKKLYMRACAP